MTSPRLGWFLSAPVHAVQVFGLPWAALGSGRLVILPKSLSPCSYSSTSDVTLPLFSSTVFHLPTGDSAARARDAQHRAVRTMMVFMVVSFFRVVVMVVSFRCAIGARLARLSRNKAHQGSGKCTLPRCASVVPWGTPHFAGTPFSSSTTGIVAARSYRITASILFSIW